MTVGLPLQEAFRFFSDVLELDRVTPDWFRLEPLAVPLGINRGTVIDYRFRWRLFRLPWRSRIADWEPPRFFAYEQERGPYRYFRHEHLFQEVPHGTRVIDIVDYRAWGGSWVEAHLVEPELARVFAHRSAIARHRYPVVDTAPAATGEAPHQTSRGVTR